MFTWLVFSVFFVRINLFIIIYVGQFDVDPNRAFDLVLNALQINKAREEELTQLLNPVSSKCLANLLGFKYQQLQADEVTPKGLLRVTALLLGQKRIFLSEIYPHVSNYNLFIFY